MKTQRNFMINYFFIFLINQSELIFEIYLPDVIQLKKTYIN